MKFLKDSTTKYGETLIIGDLLRLEEDQDGRVLIRAVSSGIGGINLDDLGDVTISSPTTDQFLRYNGASWANILITAANVGAGIFKAGNFTFVNQVMLSGTGPELDLYRGTNALDEKNWDWIIGAGGNMDLRAVNDANSIGTPAVRFTRTGAVIQQVQLFTNNTARWFTDINGHWLAGTDNSWDIGQPLANRPHVGYFGSNISIGGAVAFPSAVLQINSGSLATMWQNAGRIDTRSYNSAAAVNEKVTDVWSQDGASGAQSFAIGLARDDAAALGHQAIVLNRSNSTWNLMKLMQSGGNVTVGNVTVTSGVANYLFRVGGGAWFNADLESGYVRIDGDAGVADQGGILLDNTAVAARHMKMTSTFTGTPGTSSRYRMGWVSSGNLESFLNNGPALEISPTHDVSTTSDFIIGSLGRFDSTRIPATDNILIYSGTKWIPRYFQPSFSTGQVVATNLGDGTSATYVNDGRTPSGSPTAPTVSQDPIATAHYRAIIVDMSAYGALPADKVFVLDYSINGGAYSTNAIISTSNKIVHSNLNPANTYTYKYKIRGGSDSTYSDPSNTVAPSNQSEVNAFGVVIASQIATANLSSINANIGDITAGQIRNSTNTVGILVSGTLPGTWTTYLNLTAGGVSPLFHHPGLDLLANGGAIFSGTITAGYITLGSGYVNGGFTINNGLIVNNNGLIVNNGLLRARGSAAFGDQDQIVISPSNPTGSQWGIGTDAGPGISYGLTFTIASSPVLSLLTNTYPAGGYIPDGGFCTGYSTGLGRNVFMINSGISINSGTLGCGGDIWNPLVLFSGSGTQMVDWRRGNVQKLILKGTGQTIKLAKGNLGGVYTLLLFQDAVGNRTVTTWTSDDASTDVQWSGGVAPVLSTGGNKVDIVTFVKTFGSSSTNHYLGVIGGLNYSG